MQLCNPIGYVHSLETFGSVDGPGVRFVVFLQGCALRCKYCHNPETWAEGGEEWTVDKLFQRAWRYRNYWGKKGGITVSGGEPLRQMEFLTAFFELARSKGVHTALDTAGQPFRPDDAAYLADFDRLMKSTSLVILDLKEIDPEKHIVRRIDCFLRQRSTFWWLPERSTSGTARPCQTSGREYCGYSSSPSQWLSSVKQTSSPRTPGTKRHTASAIIIAGSSPPVKTKSPREISSSTHSSMKR